MQGMISAEATDRCRCIWHNSSPCFCEAQNLGRPSDALGHRWSTVRRDGSTAGLGVFEFPSSGNGLLLPNIPRQQSWQDFSLDKV
jgi:hypothetical protein